MEKDFDRWNNNKKNLDSRTQVLGYRAGEVWWCSIGVNIGSEQHSQTEDFSRPVLIVRRFNATLFLGIPLTTKIKKEDYRFNFTLEGVENDALILQIRTFDSRRLVRRLRTMEKPLFENLLEEVRKTI